MALSDMAVGAQGAVQQIMRQRLLEQQMAEQATKEAAAQSQQQAQQQFQNEQTLRTGDRADAQLDMMRQQHQATLAGNQFQLAGSVAEQIPKDTFLPESDPVVPLLQNSGRGSLLTKTPEFTAVGPDFAGPQQDPTITPEIAAVGRPGGFLKMATANQQNTQADNERLTASTAATQENLRIDNERAAEAERARVKAAEEAGKDKSTDNERQAARDAELARHNMAMEKLTASSAGGNAGAGWSIQQFTDPATNATKLVRVNSRTGESHPVDAPEGLQPGGQRQTRLSASQQDDLATMKTVEDLGQKLVQIGEQTGWHGVGGMGQGSIAAFAARNFGTGSTEAETLRNYIGNVQATIAKLRGGTSFTPNEQKLLETYTPTVDMDPKIIKAKVASLNEFIAIKRRNTIQFAGGGVPPMASPGAGSSTPPAGGGVTIKSIREIK